MARIPFVIFGGWAEDMAAYRELRDTLLLCLTQVSTFHFLGGVWVKFMLYPPVSSFFTNWKLSVDMPNLPVCGHSVSLIFLRAKEALPHPGRNCLALSACPSSPSSLRLCAPLSAGAASARLAGCLA